MIVLAADTSTMLGTVALLDGEQLLGEFRLRVGKGHSESLLLAADALLRLCGVSLSEIELLCVGLGPGSFTGLRIGITTFRIMAMALDLPVAGVSSLEALCLAVGDEGGVLIPTVDARRNEVYAGVFRSVEGELRRLFQDAVMSPQALADRIDELAPEPVLLFGNGVECYPESFRGLAASVRRRPGVLPSAAATGRLGLQLYGQGRGGGREKLVPNYVRKSEAELSWSRKAHGPFAPAGEIRS